MTLTKIAELAGVSVGTVSKALGGSEEISQNTTERIKKIAIENKYFGNRRIAYDRGVVAIVCPEIQGLSFVSIVSSLIEELEKYDIMTIMAPTNYDTEKARELVRYFSDYANVDGIVFVSDMGSFQPGELLLGKPIVFMGNELQGCDSIDIDVTSAYSDTLHYLRQLGHTRIGFIGEQFSTPDLEKLKRVAESTGIRLAPEYVEISKHRFREAGYDAMECLFKRGSVPTAIIAAYDSIALGAIDCIRAHGLAVPEDISIIGSGDFAFTRYSVTNLTSIRLATNEMCARCADILVNKIRNRAFTDNVCVRAEHKLVIGNTTMKNKKEETE